MSITTPRDLRKENCARSFRSEIEFTTPVSPSHGPVRRWLLQASIAGLKNLQNRLEAPQEYQGEPPEVYPDGSSNQPAHCHPFRWIGHIAQRLRESNLKSRTCLVALLAVGVATLLTYLLRGLLHGDTSLFFLCAVMVSASTGGMRAGLLTNLLTTITYAFLICHPLEQASPDQTQSLVTLGIYFTMGLLISVLSDTLYIAHQLAEEARIQAETQAQRLRFLAQPSPMLEVPGDYKSLLIQMTRAAVPIFADGATVDLLDDKECLFRVAATHAFPEKERLLYELRQRFPLHKNDDHPISKVVRSQLGQLLTGVTGPLSPKLAGNHEYREIVRSVDAHSMICVPLVARRRCLGVITFHASSPDRQFTRDDLGTARTLALRVALAIDNMRLYQEAQQEIAVRREMEQHIRRANLDLKRQQAELQQANQLLRQANELLTKQANTDGLTGLHNHRAFQERLVEEVQRAQRYRTPISVLLLDVDHFKLYNDTFGHPAGDQVLRQVAHTLHNGARNTDYVARYGGEEFVLILPNTDETGAIEIAERLRYTVEAMHGLARPITVSFGAATLNSEVTSPSHLISWADRALYASKHAGRNRVTHANALQLFAEAVVQPVVQTAVQETKTQQNAHSEHS